MRLQRVVYLWTLMISTCLSNVFDATDLYQWQLKEINCAQNENCMIICDTHQACDRATITCPRNYRCDITCDAPYACIQADIEWPDEPGLGTLSCPQQVGHYACSGIVFPIPDPDENYVVDCQGSHQQYKCENSIVYCPSNANCTIWCWESRSCYGLDIHWMMSDPSLTLSFGGRCLDRPFACENQEQFQLPTTAPSISPTRPPSDPSASPSTNPSTHPSVPPTNPSANPSVDPSNPPSVAPSKNPIPEPTDDPSASPSNTITRYIEREIKDDDILGKVETEQTSSQSQEEDDDEKNMNIASYSSEILIAVCCLCIIIQSVIIVCCYRERCRNGLLKRQEQDLVQMRTIVSQSIIKAGGEGDASDRNDTHDAMMAPVLKTPDGGNTSYAMDEAVSGKALPSDNDDDDDETDLYDEDLYDNGDKEVHNTTAGYTTTKGDDSTQQVMNETIVPISGNNDDDESVVLETPDGANESNCVS